jgi:adenine-specific DNA glycosylase
MMDRTCCVFERGRRWQQQKDQGQPALFQRQLGANAAAHMKAEATLTCSPHTPACLECPRTSQQQAGRRRQQLAWPPAPLLPQQQLVLRLLQQRLALHLQLQQRQRA